MTELTLFSEEIHPNPSRKSKVCYRNEQKSRTWSWFDTGHWWTFGDFTN